MKKVNLFISYCHEDKEYLKELKIYINEKNCQNINIWDDGKISPGSSWDNTIKQKLNESHIVLLLISQSFLNSNYITNTEFEIAMKRCNDNRCRIIPIFAKKCDLSLQGHINAFQGLPEDRRFINELQEERYSQYTIIQQKVNELASQMLTEINIKNSAASGDNESVAANKIEQLRKRNKIFLSVPSTEEGRKKRREFLYSVEGKIKYENWPYQIVPGIMDIDDIFEKDEAEQEAFFSECISESLYSIHIAASETDLASGFDKLQYEIAMERNKTDSMSASILWLLSTGIASNLDKSFLMNNSVVSGNDYEGIFEKIKSFDSEKERKLNELKKRFSPGKKVFMFYDFIKDHNNELRILLKTKIEDNENIEIRFSMPNATLEKDKEDLDKCDGGFIFYGSTDEQWFVMRQGTLIDSSKTQSKGICVDGLNEPEIERKINRDVIRRAFTVIKGSADLDIGVKCFMENLKITNG